jgi:hypothetical protein
MLIESVIEQFPKAVQALTRKPLGRGAQILDLTCEVGCQHSTVVACDRVIVRVRRRLLAQKQFHDGADSVRVGGAMDVDRVACHGLPQLGRGQVKPDSRTGAFGQLDPGAMSGRRDKQIARRDRLLKILADAPARTFDDEVEEVVICMVGSGQVVVAELVDPNGVYVAVG